MTRQAATFMLDLTLKQEMLVLKTKVFLWIADGANLLVLNVVGSKRKSKCL